MTYGLKYFALFASPSHGGISQEYRIEWAFVGYTGVATEIKVADVKSNPGNSSDDLTGVKGLRLNVSILTDSLRVNDFFTTGDKDIKVTVTNITVPAATTTEYVGFVFTENGKDPYADGNRYLTLLHSDGFDTLKEVPFTDDNSRPFEGKASILHIIAKCLKKTGLLLEIRSIFNVKQAGDVLNVAIPVIDKKLLHQSLFESKDCFQILEMMCETLNVQILQDKGYWYIVHPFSNSVNNGFLHRFTPEGTFIAGASYTANADVGFAEVLRPLSGGEVVTERPYGKVISEVKLIGANNGLPNSNFLNVTNGIPDNWKNETYTNNIKRPLNTGGSGTEKDPYFVQLNDYRAKARLSKFTLGYVESFFIPLIDTNSTESVESQLNKKVFFDVKALGNDVEKCFVTVYLHLSKTDGGGLVYGLDSSSSWKLITPFALIIDPFVELYKDSIEINLTNSEGISNDKYASVSIESKSILDIFKRSSGLINIIKDIVKGIRRLGADDIADAYLSVTLSEGYTRTADPKGNAFDTWVRYSGLRLGFTNNNVSQGAKAIRYTTELRTGATRSKDIERSFNSFVDGAERSAIFAADGSINRNAWESANITTGYDLSQLLDIELLQQFRKPLIQFEGKVIGTISRVQQIALFGYNSTFTPLRISHDFTAGISEIFCLQKGLALTETFDNKKQAVFSDGTLVEMDEEVPTSVIRDAEWRVGNGQNDGFDPNYDVMPPHTLFAGGVNITRTDPAEELGLYFFDLEGEETDSITKVADGFRMQAEGKPWADFNFANLTQNTVFNFPNSKQSLENPTNDVFVFANNDDVEALQADLSGNDKLWKINGNGLINGDQIIGFGGVRQNVDANGDPTTQDVFIGNLHVELFGSTVATFTAEGNTGFGTTQPTARGHFHENIQGNAEVVLFKASNANASNSLSIAINPTTNEVNMYNGGNLVFRNATKFNALANFTVSPTTVNAVTNAQIPNYGQLLSAVAAGGVRGIDVDVATTANVTLSGIQTIDGVTGAVDRIVLVRANTTATQNGIYFMKSGVWVRHTDNDTSAEILGKRHYVKSGTQYSKFTFQNANTGTITVGTTAILYSIDSANVASQMNTISIGDLGDVDIVGVRNRNVLVWNSTLSRFEDADMNFSDLINTPTTISGYGITNFAAEWDANYDRRVPDFSALWDTNFTRRIQSPVYFGDEISANYAYFDEVNAAAAIVDDFHVTTVFRDVDFLEGTNGQAFMKRLGYPSWSNITAADITNFVSVVRTSISENVTGLDYNSTTGVLSLTDGHIIPTTTAFNALAVADNFYTRVASDTRFAPKAHTHPASEITDFATAWDANFAGKLSGTFGAGTIPYLANTAPFNEAPNWVLKPSGGSYTQQYNVAAVQFPNLFATNLISLSTMNINGTLTMDGAAGAVGQALVSAGTGVTPIWKSLATSDLSDWSTAWDAKFTAIPKNTANGLLQLDAQALIPSQFLPAYVDDVLEFNTLSVFPATGESGKIYIDISTTRQYRWGGSGYIQITDGKATWGGIDGLLSNQTDLSNALNAINTAIGTKQNALNGVGFVKGLANGTIVYDDRAFELAFEKNSAFNKAFGTASNTVAQGNDQRILNGATAFTWGNHAEAGYLTSVPPVNYQINETNADGGERNTYGFIFKDLDGADVGRIVHDQTGGNWTGFEIKYFDFGGNVATALNVVGADGRMWNVKGGDNPRLYAFLDEIEQSGGTVTPTLQVVTNQGFVTDKRMLYQETPSNSYAFATVSDTVRLQHRANGGAAVNYALITDLATGGSVGNLQTVSDNGRVSTKRLQFNNGTTTEDYVVQSQLNGLGGTPTLQNVLNEFNVAEIDIIHKYTSLNGFSGTQYLNQNGTDVGAEIRLFSNDHLLIESQNTLELKAAAIKFGTPNDLFLYGNYSFNFNPTSAVTDGKRFVIEWSSAANQFKLVAL